VESFYRPATIWEAKELADMWALTLEEADVTFRSIEGDEFEKLYVSVLHAIKSPDRFTWVLEVDDKIKGFVSGYIHVLKWGYPDIIGHMDCGYIDPEHRSKGHCGKLINLFKVWAGDAQATLLTMETVFDINSADKWAEKGWKPCQIKYAMEVENG